MQVLHVCSEMFPLLKTGGLADVIGALPAAQIAEGIDTRVLLPAFPDIRRGVVDAQVVTRRDTFAGRITLLYGHFNGVGIYLIDAPHLYDRPGSPYHDTNQHAYPDNVLQAVQWSQDNPAMKGDAAVQAVASQPWDPSVKSLVAFPALLAMMGENPPWVENLGNAFLAQPHDVMDSVQRLRAIAQQTGTLKSTPQQKVIVTPAAPVSASSSTAATATAHTAAPAPTQVIKIEPTNPQVVYVPSYNPSTVYGTWPNSAYPPVYLPPPPGEQFTDSFVTVSRNLGNMLDLFELVTNSFRLGSDAFYDFSHRFVDTTFQVHRVHARSNSFQTLSDDSLSQYSCSGGTVACSVVRFRGNFFHHLRTHVFELVFQFDFTCNGNTIFGDGRRAEGFVQNYVTAFRAQGHFNCICQYVYAAQHFHTSVVTEFYVFSCHYLYSLNSYVQCRARITLQQLPECRFRT